MVSSSVIGSGILTAAAIVATYPAVTFLIQYFEDTKNTGALYVGGGFTVLAIVLCVSAIWGWSKVLRTKE